MNSRRISLKGGKPDRVNTSREQRGESNLINTIDEIQLINEKGQVCFFKTSH